MMLSAYGTGECVDVVQQWLLAASQVKDLTPAQSLYTGTGWGHASQAQKLVDSECELWVVSAGFGLVPGDEPLPSYAATFAAEENRVGDRLTNFRSHSSAHAAWWENVNNARGRTKTPLKNTFANYDRVVVALSAPYLMALNVDLDIMAQELGAEKLWLLAVSAELPKLTPAVHECLVPLTSEVERLVASPRATLNLRALVWWLSEIVPATGWNRAKQSREIKDRLSSLEPKETPVRKPLSDDEVGQWVREQRQNEGNKWPRGGKTGLLQTLRASGLACEQKRFSRICDEVSMCP